MFPSTPTAAAAAAYPDFSLTQGSAVAFQPGALPFTPPPLQRRGSGADGQVEADEAAYSSSSPLIPPAAAGFASSSNAGAAPSAPAAAAGPVLQLSKVIAEGNLSTFAHSERVISVHGVVKETQPVHRRITRACFKCTDANCQLVSTWPLKNSDVPDCEECKHPMEQLESELHVPTEDTTINTQLIMISTPHYSMNPKAQADLEEAAQAGESEETAASPALAASSPGGASVVSALSSSSSAIAAATSLVNLEAQATTPAPHVIEAQLSGAQCGQFGVGDEIEVQGRLCIRPLKDKCVMLFVRVDKIRSRSLVDRPVNSQVDELAKHPSLIPMLISGFAPNVLGNKLAKLGCLLSLVSTDKSVFVDLTHPPPPGRRNLHAIMVGRDQEVIPMLKACAMASPNGYLESLTSRNSTPQSASRFILEPAHCTESAWNETVSAAFAQLNEQEASPSEENVTISDLNQPVIGVRGTGTVEFAQTQIGMHKRGVFAIHANSSLKNNSNVHWLNPFNKYPELPDLMAKGLIHHVSGIGGLQRTVHTPTAIIIGGSAKKEVAYDDSQSFKDNVGLNSNLFNEFDLHLRLDDKLPGELQASYVEQCTSPSPLVSPRSASSAAASVASPAPSASGSGSTDRNLRMQLDLPSDEEPLPPSVLALFIRRCLQLPDPAPPSQADTMLAIDQAMELRKQGVPLMPYSWKSLQRLQRAMARLRMASKVTPRHLQDALEFMKCTRTDFQMPEQTVQFKSLGAAGGALRGATVGSVRQNFLNAMNAFSTREHCWVHPLSACWDIAVTVGIHRLVGPELFAQSFLQPMMDRGMILQGAGGKYKFDRNLRAM